MTQREIYQQISDVVNAAGCSKNPKMTIATESEFGGVYFLHVNVDSAKIEPYAQYKDSLTVYFKKRGGRKLYGMRFYGVKPVAVFSGWQETTWEHPLIFQCFDRNMFYGLVDGFPQEHKIAEESERVHLTEIQAKKKVYNVITDIGISSLYDSVEDLKMEHETVGEFRSVSCRAELQGAPILKSFCGPMYDGEDDQGRAVIRYESQEVYDILGR